MGRKSGVWWWDKRPGWYSTIDGKRVMLAKGRGEKREAERLLHKLLSAEKPTAKVDDGKSLDWIAHQFLTVAKRDLAPLTFESYKRYLTPFCDEHGEESAASLRPHHVEAWLAGRKWGPTTRANAVTAVKRLYRWARRQGHIATDTMADLARPRAKSRETILWPEQFDAIMAHVKDRTWRDFLFALWATGCRPNEVATVTAADVDLEAGTWEVINKTRHCTTPTRTIHLTPAMIEMTERLAKANPKGPIFRNALGQPWNRKMMSGRFTTIRKRLGFGPEATAYSIRHLYATDALDRGVPVATVAELMGHTDTTMIMRIYSKLKSRTDHLRLAAEQIRPPVIASPASFSRVQADQDGRPPAANPADPASPSEPPSSQPGSLPAVGGKTPGRRRPARG